MKSGRTLKKRSKPRHKRVTKHVRVRKSAAPAGASAAPARRTRRMRKSGGGSGTRRWRLWPFGKNNRKVDPLETTSVVTTSPKSQKTPNVFTRLIRKIIPRRSKTPVVTGDLSPVLSPKPSPVLSSIPNLAATSPENRKQRSTRLSSLSSVSPVAAVVSPAAARVLSKNQTPSTKMTLDNINDIIEKSDLSIPEQYNEIKSLIEKLDDSIYNEEYKKGFIAHIEKIKAHHQKIFDDYLFDLILNVNANLIEVKKQTKPRQKFIPSTQLTKFEKEFNDYKKFVHLNNERITNEKIRQLNNYTIDSITNFLTKNKEAEDAKKFEDLFPNVPSIGPLPNVPKNVPVYYTLGNIDTILRYFIIYSQLMIETRTEYTKSFITTNIFNKFADARKNINSTQKIKGFLFVIDKLLNYLKNNFVNWNMYVNNVYTKLLFNDDNNLEERLLIIKESITEEKPNLYLTSTTDIDKKNDLVRVLTVMKTFLEEI